LNSTVNPLPKHHQRHEQWNEAKGWKDWLNNLRLVTFVLNAINLIKKWVKIFPVAHLLAELTKLFNKVNSLDRLKYLVNLWDDFCYSSA